MSTPIRISSTLAPLADADNYPTHDSTFGIGGYVEFASIAARNAHPPARLRVGMIGKVLDVGKWYQVTAINPAAWAQVDLDSSGALAAANAAAATADEAAATADQAALDAASADSKATTAEIAAAEAKAAADAATAAAAGFPVEDYMGTILNLGTDPGDPTLTAGKWWQSGVSGTLTHAHAGGLVLQIGDRILSNGVVWLRFILPPVYIPANSIGGEKLSFQTVPASKLTPATRELMVGNYADSANEAVVGFATDGTPARVVLGVDALGQLKFGGETYPIEALGTDFPTSTAPYQWGWFTLGNDGLYRTVLAMTDLGELHGPFGRIGDLLFSGTGETLTPSGAEVAASNIQEIEDATAFRFFVQTSGAWRPYRVGRSGNGLRPRYQTADLNHILLYGQSNATRAGNEPGTNAQLTVTPSDRHLMPNSYTAGTTTDSGLLAPQNASDATTYRGGSLTSFHALYEGKGGADDGETMASGICKTLETRLGWKCLTSSAAVGGYAMSQLVKGQWPYENLIYQVTQCQAVATAMGVYYKVAAIPFIQGEADQSLTTWDTLVKQLSSDLNADIKAITGQAEDIVLIIEQMNRPLWDVPQPIDLEIMQAHHGDGGRIYWQSPRYHITMQNHYYPHGKRWRGCHIGETLAYLLGGDGEWEGVYLESHRFLGSDLFLRFHVPAGPLRFATSENVPSLLTNYGFTATGLTGVSIVADKVVRLTKSGSWAGVLVRYARQAGLGAQKGNLCDSFAGVAVYNNAAGSPYPLANWCAAFDLQL